MALDSLAAAADLTARDITIPAGFDADTLLASASSSVRDAAGCPISQTTSTVDLVIDELGPVPLPGVPVTDVASVAIDGVSVDESTLTDGRWSTGWRRAGSELVFTHVWIRCLPATLTVTYTHGLPTVPADIVDLVCSITAMAASGQYGTTGREQSIRLGDFSQSFTPTAGSDSPSPVSLPDTVRERLRARFGANVGEVRFR